MQPTRLPPRSPCQLTPDPQQAYALPRYMAFVITVSLALSQSQQQVEVRRAGGLGRGSAWQC